MAERKTGVIPLDLITEKDKERYSSEELVEFILKVLKFLKDEEEPHFSGRGLQEKFEKSESFFRENLEKFRRKQERFEQNKQKSDRNLIDNEQKSDRNRPMSNEICVMSNVIDIKKSKPKERRSSSKDLLEGYTDNTRIIDLLNDFIDMRKKMKAPMTVQAVKLMLSKLSSLTSDEDEAIRIIEQSIEHGWKTFYPLKEEKKTRKQELMALYEKYAKEEQEQDEEIGNDSVPQLPF